MGVIAFDCDGVLANFTRGYTKLGHQLYGTPVGDSATQETWNFEDYPRLHLDKTKASYTGPIWEGVKSSPDFWATLDPMNISVMPRINRIENKIFITNRPGINTKEQTEQFLETWGIENPIVILGSEKGPIAVREGVVAVIDDLYKNVVDIKAAVPSCYAALLYCGYNKCYHDEWEESRNGEVVLSVDHFIDRCYQQGLVVDRETNSAIDDQIRANLYRAIAEGKRDGF
jgi:hypothetical protein